MLQVYDHGPGSLSLPSTLLYLPADPQNLPVALVVFINPSSYLPYLKSWMDYVCPLFVVGGGGLGLFDLF